MSRDFKSKVHSASARDASGKHYVAARAPIKPQARVGDSVRISRQGEDGPVFLVVREVHGLFELDGFSGLFGSKDLTLVERKPK